MIYGTLSALDTYDFLLGNPAWKRAFDWLKTVNPHTPKGIQKLQGDELYVNVHGYDTLPAEQCVYESHRRYIDLQYCIAGGELIDIQPVALLEPSCLYDSDRDLVFYSRRPNPTTLRMVPGTFAIFHPSDGHAPKHADGTNTSVFKLVFKIDRAIAT